MSNETIVKDNTKISNITLTFDDSQGRVTPYTLDVLRKYGVKATFFALVTVLTKILPLKNIRVNT